MCFAKKKKRKFLPFKNIESRIVFSTSYFNDNLRF